MPLRFLNRAKMSVTGTPAAGPITLASGAVGFQSFAAAGIVDGDTVRYVIEDGADWEIGLGTYTASGTSLARTTIIASSNSGSAISASSASLVYVSVDGDDIGVARSGYSPVTFTNTTTIFGASGIYVSDQSFTLGAGDRIDIEASLYKLTGNTGYIAVSADATNGYVTSQQGDGNQIFYKYNSGAFNALSASGSGGSQTWTGRHDFKLVLHPAATNATIFYGHINNFYPNFINDSSVDIIGTAYIYLLTDDVTECAVKARIASPKMFSG